MKTTKFYLSLPLLLGAVILFSSCKTTEQKSSAATPPPQAMAPTVTSPAPAETAAAPQQVEVPAAAPVDPVEVVVTKAEVEFKAGEANYQAGHLDAAKDNFDKAFDIVLESKIPVHSDERLEREFDKIVENVNQLEMQALKEGDGFTEQKAEPAPIDEANDVTFPVDPAVREKAEAEVRETHSDLPLVMNDQVASFISYFSTKGRGTIERALERSGRYRGMIEGIFKKEGIPQDLIYLAQAESGFHPLALSRAGARGMWQFMASRGEGYGLERNWWVDDRQDPELSTEAAAKHLKDLYNEFGDWYLAMAAYNSGPLTVQRAVQRTGYADFWELYKRNALPAETKNYVPIILAMTIMAKNPAQYGLENIVLDKPVKTDVVKIDYPVDLRLVSEIVDTPVRQLQELNPSLLRMTTPKNQEFDLHLPQGTTDKFEQAIAQIPQDMRVWWRYHTVEPGETLAEIARKYHTTETAIAEVNNLTHAADLQADSTLVIPVSPGRSSEKIAFAKRPTHYKVRRGDTVLSIADDFGVPAARLRIWNHLRGNMLRAGRWLLIYRPLTAREEEAARRTPSKTSRKEAKRSGKVIRHTVRSGESLWSIAQRYHTTVEALKRDNRGVDKNLKPGQVLVIR